MNQEETPMYFWRNGAIAPTSIRDFERLFVTFIDSYCVDTSYNETYSRYGSYIHLEDEERDAANYEFNDQWEPCDFDNFPAEFKASLLLLGIT